MNTRIAVIGHPLIRPIYQKHVKHKQLEDQVIYYEATFGKLDPIFSLLQLEQNIDVIVTGWGHACFVEDLGIPVVVIKVTGLDILNTLTEAKKIDNKVVFMRYGAPFESIERYSDLVDMQIISSFYIDENDAHTKIRKFFGLGYRTFIGTSLMCDIVTNMGGNSIYVYSNDSISNAVENGLQLAFSRRTEIEKGEQFRIILEHAQEGVIAINQQQICLLVNSKAELLLNMTRTDLVKNSINNLWPTDNLTECLKSGEVKYQIIEKVNNRQFLVDYIPNIINHRVSGVIITFQDVADVQRAEQKIRNNLYIGGHFSRYQFSDIVGNSASIRKTVSLAKLFSKNDSTVLITGQSGTGKELLAQSIHAESHRFSKPFVALNCASLPENLLESELFGYEEGAFTGAKRGGHPGLFEVAHKGTLFLDEIGEISPEMQTRLLRVLQEKTIRRVGGRDLVPVDARIIAATNRDLKGMVIEGSFRQDLYYRLNVLHLVVPPLRDRLDDLPDLIRCFCIKYHSSDLFEEIHEIVKEKLSSYSWPGNIRELENIVQRLVVVIRNKIKYKQIQHFEEHLFQDILDNTVETNLTKLSASIEHKQPVVVTNQKNLIVQRKLLEKEMILQFLEKFNGDKTKTAQFLGISRSTMWRKLNS